MATPYQNIARVALINWNGLSKEDADLKIQNESVMELEGQVYAMRSIKYAVIGIAKQIGLSEDEATNFFDAVVNGPEDDEIFSIVSEKIHGFTDEQKLGVLSTIHDGWVIDNSSEKTFNKKVDRQQLRQYVPLELIGWNEVRSDLLFLSPILESVGVTVDEVTLEDAYHKMVADYLEKMQINNIDDLNNLVQQGRLYYPIMPKDLAERLLPMSDVVTSQIINNWNNKDFETAQLFSERNLGISSNNQL